ncbi:MAG: hypothetical protein CMQ34_11725 [Gammaproteobacteria bacterium]|nr:hypothetical protein [Gammaproteobacteria bacterium]
MIKIGSFSGLLLFLILYLGDFSIGGIYLLPVVALFSTLFVLYFPATLIIFTKNDLILFGFITLFTCLDLTLILFRDSYFSDRAVVNISLLLAFPFLKFLFSVDWRTRWYVPIAAFLLVGALISDGRGFIFGPNVLYRVILFLSFCSGLRFVYFLGTLLVPVATLSRGAFVTSFIVFLQYFQRKNAIFILIFSIVLLFLLSFLTATLVDGVQLPRYLSLYDYGGSTSILDRQSVAASLLDSQVLIFGMTDSLRESQYGFIVYPHNSIIELIWAYGIFGVFFFTYLVFCFFRINSHFAKVLFLILFIPTLFSGGYIDNMVAVFFSCMLVNYNAATNNSNSFFASR